MSSEAARQAVYDRVGAPMRQQAQTKPPPAPEPEPPPEPEPWPPAQQ
jgi:hypothetical protein